MSSVIIQIISYNANFLKVFTRKILLNLKEINLTTVSLPKKRKIFSILKSPFVNKKAIEQFSLTTHKKLLIIKQVQEKEVKKLFNQIPSKNIAIKIRKIV